MRLVLFVLLCIASVSVRQSPRLPQLLPVDAATEDESLRAARDAALTAAKTRNVEGLMALVSPTVFIGEGPNAPGATLRVLRESLGGITSTRWVAGVGRFALSHGGAFTTTRGAMEGQREFCAPYFYATFPTELPTRCKANARHGWSSTRTSPCTRRRTRRAVSSHGGRHVIVQANGGEQDDATTPRVRWQSVDFPEDSESFVLATQIGIRGAISRLFCQRVGQMAHQCDDRGTAIL